LNQNIRPFCIAEDATALESLTAQKRPFSLNQLPTLR